MISDLVNIIVVLCIIAVGILTYELYTIDECSTWVYSTDICSSDSFEDMKGLVDER